MTASDIGDVLARLILGEEGNHNGFTLQITEATSLGQLQVVCACLDIELRTKFHSGLYRAAAFAPGAAGNGSGLTMAQAIRGAILDVREKLALRLAEEGPYR